MSKISKPLHFTDEGKGYPVVLLHGYLESTFIWKGLAIELGKEYRVICIDLPGHGKSERLQSEPSIDKIADAVLRVLVNLSIDKAIIIGHSMGGYVGLSLLEKHPEAIHSLILLHSKASSDTKEAKKKRDLGVEMLRNHPRLYIKESIQNLFWDQSDESIKTDKLALIEEALKGNPEGYIDALIAMKNRPDRLKLLHPGNAIIYIAGRQDPVISIEHSLSEMEMLSEGSGFILDHSGHMGFYEEKKKCEQMILACVRSFFKYH